jgi:hypothetical protein
MEKKLKHLELIQGVINRMAGNLFFLKGWAITILAGLSGLSAKDANPNEIYIALFLAIIFWVLDGYFLSQERKYRDLYDHVRKLPDGDIDFSMDTRPYDNGYNSWMCSIFSKTLMWFYFSLIMVMVIIIGIIK